MYFSEWKIEDDKTYYQTEVSFKKSTTPFFKVRIIPVEINRYYMIAVRDYKSGEMLYNTVNFGITKTDEDNLSNLKQAKVYAKALAQLCMRDLTSSYK